MKKTTDIVRGAGVAAFLLLAGNANAASLPTLINLNAYNASNPGNQGNVESLLLQAGAYKVTPVDEPLEAWNAWNRQGTTVTGCDGAGENCSKGFIHQYTVTIGGVDTLVQGGGKYANATLAFNNASSFLFSLAGEETVSFKIEDSNYSDNFGGVSLSVSAVPLPAAAWLFLSAIGGIVGVKRLRRSKTAASTAPALA